MSILKFSIFFCSSDETYRVTIRPGLYLMAMTDVVIGKGADTTRLGVQERQIIPQWVIKKTE